jgi:hypothetical protein
MQPNPFHITHDITRLEAWSSLIWINFKFEIGERNGCRSQWPRGLRHEPSSPARTLGSWIRIPLKAWMSVCFYSVFVLFCGYVAALRRADPPSKKSYRLCTDLETEKAAKVQRAVEP